jgi:hypothetical protein
MRICRNDAGVFPDVGDAGISASFSASLLANFSRIGPVISSSSRNAPFVVSLITPSSLPKSLKQDVMGLPILPITGTWTSIRNGETRVVRQAKARGFGIMAQTPQVI